MSRRITIAANSEITERAEGKVLAILSATGTLEIIPDIGERQPVSAGRKINLPPRTKRIRFIDTSGATNTVIFYNGDEDMQLDASPIGARLKSDPISEGTLITGAGITPSNPPGDRASYIVSNRESAADKQLKLITLPAAASVFYIPAGETLEYATSEILRLKNDCGTDVDYCFSQKYYL